MTKPIPAIEAELGEEFDLFDDWMQKYQYIIDMGHELPPLPPSDKTDDNLVHGCQSKVWLTASYADGMVQYAADSDAIITKGLISLLVRVLSGHRPEEILQADLQFVDRIGIREHLSPTRSNGLNNMIKRMKYIALAFQHRDAASA